MILDIVKDIVKMIAITGMWGEKSISFSCLILLKRVCLVFFFFLVHNMEHVNNLLMSQILLINMMRWSQIFFALCLSLVFPCLSLLTLRSILGAPCLFLLFNVLPVFAILYSYFLYCYFFWLKLLISFLWPSLTAYDCPRKPSSYRLK